MKSKQTNKGGENVNGRNSLSKVCLNSCKGILAQINKAKDAIFTEARGRLKEQDQILRLALNEAEALAWQTLYPHLVFPALAAEKVQGIAVWNNHQQAVNGRIRARPF